MEGLLELVGKAEPRTLNRSSRDWRRLRLCCHTQDLNNSRQVHICTRKVCPSYVARLWFSLALKAGWTPSPLKIKVLLCILKTLHCGLVENIDKTFVNFHKQLHYSRLPQSLRYAKLVPLLPLTTEGRKAFLATSVTCLLNQGNWCIALSAEEPEWNGDWTKSLLLVFPSYS